MTSAIRVNPVAEVRRVSYPTCMTQTSIPPVKGLRFEHARKIVGDGAERRPDVCTVTKVRGVVVYYRNESGMLLCTDLAKFDDAVGRIL